MLRGWGFVFALAVFAGAASAEEDRAAYAEASARLTEQLNAVISERVELSPPPPPAKRDEPVEKAAAPPRRQALR
jgi:hypothetical protein